MTEVRRIDVRMDADGWLAAAAEHVRGGGLIAYPTETVYGLGGGLSEPAVARMQALKSRDPGKPFLLLVPSRESVDGLRWTPSADDLARSFWPGSLTLVLADPAGIFPPWVRSGAKGSVGVRVSPHPVVQQLVSEVGALTSTSLNGPGEPPAASGSEAVEVVRRLGAPDVLVLDAGVLPPSGSSTVVDCTGADPVVIREGTIPIHRLRCATPGVHGREQT